MQDSNDVRKIVLHLLERWVTICHAASAGRADSRVFTDYMRLLNKHQVLKSDGALERFIRVTITLCVQSCGATAKPPTDAKPATALAGKPRNVLGYTGFDALSKLVVILLKASATAGDKLATACKVLDVSARTVLRDAEANAGPGGSFDQRPYLRLLSNLMHDVILPAPEAEVNAASARYGVHVLTAFTNVLHSLRPTRLPCFALAWMALASHRALVARLLAAPAHAGWPLLRRLLVDQLRFLGVLCRAGVDRPATRVVYRGVQRTFLALAHDAPEFVADHHHALCEVIPATCIHLRNFVLSTFARGIVLPDIFTPSLKIDKLEAMSVPPRIVGDPADRLPEALAARLSAALASPAAAEAAADDICAQLRCTDEEAEAEGGRFSWARISSLVLVACIRTTGASPAGSVPPTPALALLRALLARLEPDGRYLLLNAVANQLRFPSSHTHFCSMAVLHLFEDADDEAVREHITRVLLERLITSRPHPWGLVITFIELIKQPRFAFWSHDFTRSSPEILGLLERIARSCKVARPTE